MQKIDYNYISENMANISRILIRIYENNSCTEYHTTIPFEPDPALPYLEKLLAASDNVSCHITPL